MGANFLFKSALAIPLAIAAAGGLTAQSIPSTNPMWVT